MWYLQRQKGTSAQKKMPVLTDFLIGRARNSQICCPSVWVSRTHCFIHVIGDSIAIRDLNSSNGVYINTKIIKPGVSTPVNDGDIIGLGIANIESEDDSHYIYKIFREDAEDPGINQLDQLVVTERTVGDPSNNTCGLNGDADIGMLPVVVKCENSENIMYKKREADSMVEGTSAKVARRVSPLASPDQQANATSTGVDVKLKSLDSALKAPSTSVRILIKNDAKQISGIALRQPLVNEVIEIDSDSNDLFEDEPFGVNNQEFSSKIKPDPGENSSCLMIMDEIPTYDISSDEDELDNIWRQKLSQNTSMSPPPEIKHEDEEWWPDLSQAFYERHKSEAIIKSDKSPPHTPDRIEAAIENEVPVIEFAAEAPAPAEVPTESPTVKKTTNVTLMRAPIVLLERLKEPLHPLIPIVETFVRKEKPLTSRIDTNAHLKLKSYAKPTIIDAPHQLNTSMRNKLQKIEQQKLKLPKENLSKKGKKSLRRNVTIKQRVLPDTKVERKPAPSKILLEARKQKLKDIADKIPSASGSKTDSPKVVQTKPKVKVTHENRSDALVAAIAGGLPKEKSATINRRVSVDKPSVSSKSGRPSTTAPKRKESANHGAPYVSRREERPQVAVDPNGGLRSIMITPEKIKRKKSVRLNLTPEIRYFEKEPVTAENEPRVVPIGNAYTNSRQRQESNGKATIHLNDILWVITKWDPCWLTYNNSNVNPEELCAGAPLLPIAPSFDTYDHYYNTFVRLMLCELWTNVKRDWDCYKSNRHNIFTATVDEVKPCPDHLTPGKFLTKINCRALANREDTKSRNYPQNGLLAIAETENPDRSNGALSFFAYIISTFKQNYNDSIAAKSMNISVQNATTMITCLVLTRYSGVFSVGRIIRLIPVTKLAPQLRCFIALNEMPRSPLLDIIIHPRSTEYVLPPFLPENLFTKHPLNDSQFRAVFNTLAACFRPDARVSIVVGPPGTGKSLVIRNIVLQLIYGGGRFKLPPLQRPRILLCAPSNCAIDELTIELLKIRMQITNYRFRMVRIGHPDTIHPGVREITSWCLAEKFKTKQLQGFNTELKNIEAKKLAYVQQIEEMRMLRLDTSELDKRLVDAARCGEKLTQMAIEANKKNVYDYEYDILYPADIVCTTLNSCYSSLMERLSRDPQVRFTCAIVDEASQATEVDTLIPLLMGINTLVLVGDNSQLPATVFSQDAKSYGFCNSLMSRLERNFHQADKAPVSLLEVQYRMHPEICKWPNEYFYMNRLQNAPQLLVSRRSVLPPYRIFMHDYVQQKSEENEDEAMLVVNLTRAILKETESRLTIGIITPYRRQLIKIKDAVAAQAHNDFARLVDVKTIDSFQGQERDVIILSCVRTGGIGFLADNQRLNVALTRARLAMYVVVNFKSLQDSLLWRSLRTDGMQRNMTLNCRNDKLTSEALEKMLRNS